MTNQAIAQEAVTDTTEVVDTAVHTLQDEPEPEKYPVTDLMKELRDKFQKLGYVTSFSHHHSDNAEFPKADHFHGQLPIQHVAKTLVAIYAPFSVNDSDRAFASIFHPKQGQPIHLTFVKTSGNFVEIKTGENLDPYANHYTTLEEVLADHPADYAEWNAEYQESLFKVRIPKWKFQVVNKPLAKEEFDAMMASIQSQQAANEEAPTGSLAEAMNEEENSPFNKDPKPLVPDAAVEVAVSVTSEPKNEQGPEDEVAQ